MLNWILLGKTHNISLLPTDLFSFLICSSFILYLRLWNRLLTGRKIDRTEHFTICIEQDFCLNLYLQEEYSCSFLQWNGDEVQVKSFKVKIKESIQQIQSTNNNQCGKKRKRNDNSIETIPSTNYLPSSQGMEIFLTYSIYDNFMFKNTANLFLMVIIY